jgi:hypothetical protein
MNEQQDTQKDLDSFVEAFTAGLEPDEDVVAEQTPPPAPDTVTAGNKNDTAPDVEDSPDANKDTTKTKETGGDGQEPPKEQVENVFNKSDRAFAELRTTNKAQGDILLRMAKLAKIDAKTPAEALAALTAHVSKIEANHGNLTYEEVERIRQSDKEIADRKSQLYADAHAGFDRLKQTHGLSDQDIVSFAEELKAKGINPFEMPIDLVVQYRGMHYDQLIAQAKELGKQEEIGRRTKAQTQSTSPLTRQGGTNSNDPGESLNSVDRLSAFLNSK